MGKGEVKLLESKEEFDSFLKEAGNTLVVVDFFAEWCGPCKAIKPKFLRFAEEYGDAVLFAKVDVDDNTETAESEGISAMPTFKLYRKGKKVAEVTGANDKKLKEVIDQHK